MEDHDPKEQTLQALEMFIQTQQALLARQTSDIARLERLKLDLSQTPSVILTNLNEENTALRLSAQSDLRLNIPNEIDWRAFEKADTTPLRAIQTRTKNLISSLRAPLTIQTSPLSELQLMVKQARKSIVDPVIAQVTRSPLFLLPEVDEAEADDPLAIRRKQEREKILELKKRKVMMRGGGLSLRRPCTNVVYIREDAVDETMEVDIGAGDFESRKEKPEGKGLEGETFTQLGSDTSGLQLVEGHRSGKTIRDANDSATPPTVSGRIRKPTVKLRMRSEDNDIDQPPQKRRKASSRQKEPRSMQSTTSNENPTEISVNDVRQSTPPLAPVQNSIEKRKSETYKQAWSMEEQNLLEQLLEKIPEGEKNRWQKISKAMGGRRTPRQVASRVQKYLEKLKKYGVVG